MICCHIFRILRNLIENLFYSDTNIRVLQQENLKMRQKSVQDDCQIEHLRSSCHCKDQEIERMQCHMQWNHDEMMATKSAAHTHTTNNFNAPMTSYGGTLSGDVVQTSNNNI